VHQPKRSNKAKAAEYLANKKQQQHDLHLISTSPQVCPLHHQPCQVQSTYQSQHNTKPKLNQMKLTIIQQN
jgi:hypothetical protein